MFDELMKERNPSTRGHRISGPPSQRPRSTIAPSGIEAPYSKVLPGGYPTDFKPWEGKQPMGST
jgi:hypothetical protein